MTSQKSPYQQSEAALVAPISVDYGGVVPQAGDHLAIPVGLWSDMCWLAGAASVHMPTSTIAKRANDAIAQRFPVVRFESGASSPRCPTHDVPLSGGDQCPTCFEQGESRG